MKRATTYSQKRKRARGGRSADDKAYDRQRARDPYLARASVIRGTHRWKVVSRAYRRLEPLCRHCKDMGRTTPVDQVDHIVSLVELLRKHPPDRVRFVTPSRAFDHDNLQSLCTTCHAKKSQEERKRQ